MSLWKLLTAAYNSAGNSVKIRADSSTSSLIAINNEHHEVHAGNHYFIKTFLEDTGGSGNTNYFAFTTPDSLLEIHAKANFAPDVDTEISIFEDATITGGTPVPGINCCRCSSNVAELAAVAAPTISVAGTKIWTARNGGGRNPVGVAPGLNYEIVAKHNSTYVFEIIKRVVTDLIIDIDFFWYEHTRHIS
jgi:hypothetical protein